MAAIKRGFGTGNPPDQNHISTKQGMVMHMNRTKKFGFFGVVAYIVLACASFVPAFLFDFTAPALLSRTTGSILCVCLFAVLIAWCTFAKVKSRISIPQFAFYLSGGFVCIFSTYSLTFSGENSPLLLIVVCLMWLVFAAAVMYERKMLNTSHIILIIAIAGFILRLGYIAYTAYNQRQHDVYDFGGGSGHSQYILYFFENTHLPDFDPRNIWQFYHPPLHHMIAGLWMRSLNLFGMDFARIVENIQLLTLFYSSACMMICYRIFTELGLRKGPLVLSFALIAFNPSFIIFAGSINNDILSITFMLGAILWTLRWYKARTMRNIIPIALCIGFGMMTKLSAALVAPAIGLLFLLCFIIHFKKEWLSLIKQYVVFAVICVPLGLWWSVRCYVLFKVPFGYVPLIGEAADQFIGSYSVRDRLLDFRINDVFMAWGENRGGFFEHNPILGLLKTSLFGEFRLNEMSGCSELIFFFSTLLFYVNLVLVVLALIAMLSLVFRRKNTADGPAKVFWITLFITVFGSYIRFCFSFPHTCTMNVRYAMPLIVTGIISLGVYMQRKQGKFQTAISLVAVILIPVFSLFSSMVYILLAC